MSHLVLVGMMGSGKTTVGELCAQELARPFVDTDDVVLTLTGMSFDEFFATHGEPAFRDIERQAVADVVEGGIEVRRVRATLGGEA